MPIPKWAKDTAEKVDEKLESVADDALDRAKSAKHTWIAIVGFIAAIFVIFGLLLVF